jgi:hypothetical protein
VQAGRDGLNTKTVLEMASIGPVSLPALVQRPSLLYDSCGIAVLHPFVVPYIHLQFVGFSFGICSKNGHPNIFFSFMRR